MPVAEWYDGTIEGNQSANFYAINNPAMRYVDIQARPITGIFPAGPPRLRVTDLSFEVAENDPNNVLTYHWVLHNDSPEPVRFKFRMLFEDY
jgi:hypothetical protein